MMTEQEKIDFLISPEKAFPPNLKLENLLGNQDFINPFSQYLSILNESQYWPVSLINDVQLKRFIKLTQYLSKNSPFWAEHFEKNNFFPDKITKMEDAQRLPVLRRDDLLRFGKRMFVINETNKQYIFSRNTSGTTSGIPMKVMFDERELIISTLVFHFRHPVFQSFPLRDLFRRKFMIILGSTGSRHHYAKNFAEKIFRINSADLEDRNIRSSIYASIRQAQPAVLIGFSSILVRLARLVDLDKASFQIMAVRIQGESVFDDDRNLIERVFNAPIVNTLSSNGLGNIGFECDKQQNIFHLNTEHAILDFIDDKEIKVPTDVNGELVITSLVLSATPLLRCAIGDIGKAISAKCACGRTLPIFNFIGRRDDEFILPSGSKIRSTSLYAALAKAGVLDYSKQFQIIQEATDRVRFLIIPKMKITEQFNLEVKLRLALTSILAGEKVFIEIEYVQKIPERGNKPIFFIPLNRGT